MTSPYDIALAFFEACEAPSGWAGCQQFATADATFSAQSEPLMGMTRLADYCDWMHAFGTVTAPGARYELHSSSYDEQNRQALFFATYHAKHTGEGGPVPATGKETASHYVYAISVNEALKVSHVTKVWNAPWAMRELGWDG